VKASISGRIACECLIEQEKTNNKLIEDRKKLSRDFKLSRAANSDLEKRCLNWLWPSKNARTKRRPLRRLLRVREEISKNFKKTHDEDLRLIENLRKDYDKSSKAAKDLRTNNADLAKTLSNKE
jgi:hypothetical protein